MPVTAFNPYKILGVNKKATVEDVKRRFRKLAMKHHPDHGGDANIFEQLRKAHDILLDPAQRQLFDDHGLVSGDPACQLHFLAIKKLQEFFISILSQMQPEQLDTLDVVACLRKNVTEHRAGFEKDLVKAERMMEEKQKTLAILRKRVKQRNNKTPNFFLPALEQAILNIPGQIAALKQNIELTTLMLEILEDFSYETIAQPVMRTVHMGGGMHTMVFSVA